MFRRPPIDQSHYRPPKEEPAQYHTDRWPIVTFLSETKKSLPAQIFSSSEPFQADSWRATLGLSRWLWGETVADCNCYRLTTSKSKTFLVIQNIFKTLWQKCIGWSYLQNEQHEAALALTDLILVIKWWWFNASKTIEKPLMPMVPWRKNINNSIAPKKWPSNRSSRCILYFSTILISRFNNSAREFIYESS